MTDSPYSRNVSFSTAYNFRDVGGWSGLDGRPVRWRRLFRTDTIHRLEGADWDTFAALGVRTVIDLRRENEIELHGRVRDYEGLTYLNLVLKHVAWEDVEERDDIDHERWIADRYLNFIDEGHEALHDALSVIADPEAAPVVVHCMAGKDRTGVTLALTLSLLGVSDKDIAEDYALTTTSMQGLVDYLKVHNPSVVEGKEHMFDSPPGAMLLFLSELRARHGSVEDYVRSIGVTDEQIAAMRGHLLDLD